MNPSALQTEQTVVFTARASPPERACVTRDGSERSVPPRSAPTSARNTGSAITRLSIVSASRATQEQTVLNQAIVTLAVLGVACMGCALAGNVVAMRVTLEDSVNTGGALTRVAPRKSVGPVWPADFANARRAISDLAVSSLTVPCAW